MNKDKFFVVSQLKIKTGRIMSCNPQVHMMALWNQHQIIHIWSLSKIYLTSAIIPAIRVAVLENRLTSWLKFLGLLLLYLKKCQHSLLKDRLKASLKKKIRETTSQNTPGSSLPWEKTVDALFKPRVDYFSDKRCSHWGKLLCFNIKLLLGMSIILCCVYNASNKYNKK